MYTTAEIKRRGTRTERVEKRKIELVRSLVKGDIFENEELAQDRYSNQLRGSNSGGKRSMRLLSGIKRKAF